MAENAVEVIVILFKYILDSGKLISIVRPLLSHLLDILDVSSLSGLWMVPEIKWTIFKPFFVCLNFTTMLFLLLFICLLLSSGLHTFV